MGGNGTSALWTSEKHLTSVAYISGFVCCNKTLQWLRYTTGLHWQPRLSFTQQIHLQKPNCNRARADYQKTKAFWTNSAQHSTVCQNQHSLEKWKCTDSICFRSNIRWRVMDKHYQRTWSATTDLLFIHKSPIIVQSSVPQTFIVLHKQIKHINGPQCLTADLIVINKDAITLSKLMLFLTLRSLTLKWWCFKPDALIIFNYLFVN